MSVRELKGIREKIKYMTITTEKLQWNLYVSNFAVVNESKNVSELRCIFWLDRGRVGGWLFPIFSFKGGDYLSRAIIRGTAIIWGNMVHEI